MSLSPSLLVAITAHGVRLPACGDHPSWALGFGELELLVALRDPRQSAPAEIDDVTAGVSQRTATELATLQRFTGHLRAIGRLRDDRAPEVRSSPLIDGDRWECPAQPRGVEPEHDPHDAMVLSTPVQLVLGDSRFWFLDPEGHPIAGLSSLELIAAGEYRWPLTFDDWLANQRRVLGSHALDRPALLDLASRLVASGLLGSARDDELSSAQGRDRLLGSQELARLRKLVDVCSDEAAARSRARRDARSRSVGRQRPFVVPYNKVRESAPLALGLVMATAMAYEGGRLHNTYAFEPNWVARRSSLRRLADEAPIVALFSNYTWSHGDNIAVSAALKAHSPDSVTIHGGPDVPSRKADADAYLAEHPHVDIMVRGEGEVVTAEILDALDGRLQGRKGHLPDLRAIGGVTYRDGDEMIRGDDRERITDLDAIPSPYLSGLFEPFARATASVIILETNRGCPYGCTFCDWGSATRSRIRKFPLERVFGELEWAARHHMPMVFIADANFGMLPRDVEIAEEIARLKRLHGYPLHFTTNYAKNTTTHLETIVQTMTSAGVITEGTLSLQSTDPNTLGAVQRSNIKLTEYNKLATAFRNAGLPLFVDLMMGLPGSDLASFRNDLQHVIDSELCAKISRTELLVNSPMNAPEYKARHRIHTEAMTGDNLKVRRPLLVSTASYTRDDFDRMERLRRIHLVGENYGCLRFIARFVRQEAGILESALFEHIDHAIQHDPDRFPYLRWATETLPEMLVAPASWALYYHDLGRLLRSGLGIADSSGLAVALRVQRALMPERGRRFPEVVALDHDFGRWFNDILKAKSDDPTQDWCRAVPRLQSYGPALFEVDDPTDVCTTGIGHRVTSDPHGAWELQSTVARAAPKRHLLVDH